MEKIGTIIVVSLYIGCCTNLKSPAPNLQCHEIRVWNILSDDTIKAKIALDKSAEYQINDLQLSHHLIMNLKDVRNFEKLQKTRILIQEANKKGIENVLIWDHALCNLSYYPDHFKNKDVIIEFDLGHEYHGQGIIASILPEITISRWKYYANQKNVIGYVARTDRYGTTQYTGRPAELNLYGIKRINEDTSLNANTIVEEFIPTKYGQKAVGSLMPVFLETDEIIRSLIYKVGLHMNDHSRFEFDYPSIYSRHCSGKWLHNPVINPGHGIDNEFHYWKDIVEHLCPARYKRENKT